MKKTTIGLSALAVAVLLVGCGGGDNASNNPSKHDDDAVAANGVYSQQDFAAGFSSGAALTRDDLRKSAAVVKAYSAPSAAIVLEALPDSAVVSAKSANAQATGQGIDAVALQIGATRAVAATKSGADLAQKLRWSPTPEGGQAASISFTSTGAKGVRLGLLIERLPQEATLRFFSADGSETHEVSAADVLKGIERNVAADGDSPQARTYWSPDLGGEQTTLEIAVPAGVSASAVRIAVPSMVHSFVNVLSDDVQKFSRKIGESESCHNDYACKADKPDVGRAVARMVYPKGNGYYLCTGTLLADAQNSKKPYFLTAHHCISTQTSATSMQTFWFYETNTCGGAEVAPAARRKNDGARLLFTKNQTDSTLLLLNSAPPQGAYYAGWYAKPVPLNVSVLGIHHPAGDVKKYSEGRVTAYNTCTNGNGESYSCRTGGVQGTNFLNVQWSSGITEGGSSGSGLFAKTTAGDYRTLGQLLGGSDSCRNIGGGSQYGRFDVSYQLGMFQWLNAPAAPATATRPRPRGY